MKPFDGYADDTVLAGFGGEVKNSRVKRYTIQGALHEAKKAMKGPDLLAPAYYWGYADGLTAAKHHKHIDDVLQRAADSYARGYSAGFHSLNEIDRNMEHFIKNCEDEEEQGDK